MPASSAPRTLLLCSCFLTLLFHSTAASPRGLRFSAEDIDAAALPASNRASTSRSSSKAKSTFFEVSRPIHPPRGSRGPCSTLLLSHSFASTFNKPPITAAYSPPACLPAAGAGDVSFAVLEWTAECHGVQYGRTYGVWLGGVELLRGSTAEPRPGGVTWSVHKDVTKYSSLLSAGNSTLTVYLGNLIDDNYNGVYDANLTLHLYFRGSAAAAVLLILLVAAAFLARRRRKKNKNPQSSRVDHALSSGSSLLPTSTTPPKQSSKYAEVVVGTSSSDAAGSSSAAASSLESPPRGNKLGRISAAAAGVEMGWGRWYELEELEAATRGFRAENVVGEGGYGTVYRGVLDGGEVVAVKNLFDHKGQAEQEFKVEVESIGRVRHKHLTGLIGYCAEGPKRMLVYEFVENGNLEQWLHGDVGPVSPLTWEIRLKIAIGTAKGIAYLHEGLEPKVVHRDIKSSNILLDKKWNPKVSDFGMAKVLGAGSSYVTTRVMGTFGYVAPEYASTGMLNESSDVYSFGVLLMELVSGRSPVDYNRPPGEVNLVEWFKGMVGSRRVEELVDPRIVEAAPAARALNRVLLVCLRCIDSDAHKRPKMGQIVHMLEGDEFPFRTEHRSPRAAHRPTTNARASLLSDKVGADDSDRSMWR